MGCLEFDDRSIRFGKFGSSLLGISELRLLPKVPSIDQYGLAWAIEEVS
jgi:hypothetical protein